MLAIRTLPNWEARELELAKVILATNTTATKVAELARIRSIFLSIINLVNLIWISLTNYKHKRQFLYAVVQT